MTETRQVLCDTCERDITYTGNSVDYRIVVKSESLSSGPGGGVVTDMMVYPPIPKALHFCGVRCLMGSEWMSKLNAWYASVAAVREP